MSLRINTNVEAIDTLRNLTISQSMFDTAMQQLSSGKRINSAADDAAGYAISQKLMAQTNGLNQAASNAQDGISMVQTASGGLNTTQQLLQRMRQLAVQSANDTNTSSDRTALQAEANQISQEITQIAQTSQFNTKNLLDGSLGSTGTLNTGGGAGTLGGFLSANNYSTAVTSTGSLSSGSYSFALVSGGTQATTGAAQGVGTASTAASTYIGDTTNGLKINGNNPTNTPGLSAGNYSFTVTGSKGSATINITSGVNTGDTFQSVMDKINAVSNQTGVTASFNGGSTTQSGLKLTSAVAGSAQTVSITTGSNLLLEGLGLAADSGTGDTTQSLTINSNSGAGLAGTDGKATLLNNATNVLTTIQGVGNVFTDSSSGFTMDLSQDALINGHGALAASTITVQNNGANLQIGANQNQNLVVNIGDMRAQALGVQGASSTQALDISSSSAAASAAIGTIDSAIQVVSAQAANLGAVQNRLQAAIGNLNIGSENMQSAYSAITNVNMAQESTALASAQILQQSGIAMLAQANQAPQGVLKLLG